MPTESARSRWRVLAPGLVAAIVAACSTPPPRPAATSAPAPSAPAPSARYYAEDGPPAQVPEGLDRVPDAVPRPEPLHRFANRPYVVMGREYVPATALGPYRERGVASWYGRMFHGRRTSTGEVYDMYAMTAAHPTLPLPSYARVTSVANGRSVVVRVNDRGPFLHGRLIDLSYAAAYRLGIAQPGSGEVVVEALWPGEATYAAAAAAAPVAAPPAGVPAAGASPAEGTVTTPLVLRQPIVAGTPAPSSPGPPPPAPVAAQPATAVAPASAPAPIVAPPVPSSSGTPLAAESPVQPAVGGYVVQLGAFASEPNAQNFLAHVRERLAAAEVEPRVRQAGGLYRVYVGPYTTREEARRRADRLAQSFGVNTAIAPH